MNLWGDLFRGNFLQVKENLSQQNPKNTEARLLEAYLAVKEGRFSKAISIAENLNPPETENHYRLLVMAEANARYGSITKARNAASALLDHAKNQKDRQLEALAIFSISLAELQLNRYDVATTHLHKAKSMIDPNACPQIYGEVLEALGVTLLEKGEVEKAMETLMEARDFFLINDLNPHYLITLVQIGNLYSAIGEYREAMELFKEAALASEDRNFTYGAFLATAALGSLYVKLGQFDLALLQFSLALRLSLQSETKAEVIKIHQKMAEIYYYKEKFGIALALVESSLQMQEGLGNPLLTARSLFLKGLILPKLHIPNIGVINQLEQIWINNSTETIRLKYLTLLLQNRQVSQVELNELKRLLHRSQISIDTRLKAISILINQSLLQIEKTKKIQVSDLFEIINLLNFFAEFADKQGSIFHKLVAILLKARLYLLRGEKGLAEVAIELAEALIIQNELYAFQNDLNNLKTLLRQDIQIENFENQILDQLGIDEELNFIYKPKTGEENAPVAFLISNENHIEILNISLKNPEQVSPFVSGLLFAVNLLQKSNMDLKISEVKLVDFSILFKTVDGLTYWLIFKGKPTREEEVKFNRLVDQLKEDKWLNEQKDKDIIDLEGNETIINILIKNYS